MDSQSKHIPKHAIHIEKRFAQSTIKNLHPGRLYQKWCEVHDKFPTKEVNSFFDDKPTLLNPEQGALLQEIKNNFWLPEDQEEYLELEPELLWTDGDDIKSITGSKMPGSTKCHR